MVWFVVGFILFLVAHKAVEGVVVSGENAARKRFYWNLGTAGLLMVVLAATWVFSFVNASWRMEWGGLLLIGSPLIVLALAAFAYLNYLAYTDGEDEGAADY